MKNTEDRDLYQGNLIATLGMQVTRAEASAKLKGVQLGFNRTPQAYRAKSENGSLVLCDAHLDKRRGRGEQWALTGEAFAPELCDDCEDDVERGRR